MKHFLTISLFFLALALSVYGQVPDYVPTEGLVAWYPFNGNANDESGNGKDGTSFGATLTADRFGLNNAAYYFNGSHPTYIDLPELDENLGVQGSKYTASLWFKNTLGPSAENILIHASSSYFNNSQVIFSRLEVWDQGSLKIYHRNTDTNNEPSGGFASIEDWHFVSVLIDAEYGTYALYLDGEFQPAFDFTFNPSESYFEENRKWQLGSISWATNHQLTGSIDDVTIHNRILEETELLSLYNGGVNFGCMDENACNFSFEAIVDDGSCVSCEVLSTACGLGTVWDSETQECIVANPTDSNLDGCTDLNDLMDILANYGDCAVAEFTCGDDIEHEGYSYSTVEIGDQCWFSENCRYIPSVSPSSEGSETEPYYYVYDYQGTDITAAQATSNYSTYGVLYNWPAVMTDGICPTGWHIPTDLEWQTMEIALGMSASEASSTEWRGTDEGHKMKSTSGWNNGGNGTNLSGFTGLSGGYTGSNNFFNNGLYGFWWSAAESGSSSWNRRLDGSSAKVFRANYDLNRQYGFSARCIRD
jgi:uncharacterized protein (TIGR02145 family)